MFLRSQTGLLRAETKTMHPHECGILGGKGVGLGWLSHERFPRACSTSADCFACKQDSGRAKARGASAAFGRTAPTRMRRARRRFEYPRLSCTPTGSLLASISTHASECTASVKVQTAH